MDLELKGRAALVTGSSRGIGRAIVTALAREGARVCLSARGAEGLEKAAAELRASGAEVVTVAGDVATPEGAAAAVDAAVRAFGALDILVNNVGGSGGAGAFDVATAAQWKDVVDRNLMAAVWCSQHAVERMKARGGGCIVHINSIYGREYGTSAPYTAAKAASRRSPRRWRWTWRATTSASTGWRRAPSSFPGGAGTGGGRRSRRRWRRWCARNCPGAASAREEVADVVVFLCSERARWVTGATVPVDGGQGRAF